MLNPPPSKSSDLSDNEEYVFMIFYCILFTTNIDMRHIPPTRERERGSVHIFIVILFSLIVTLMQCLLFLWLGFDWCFNVRPYFPLYVLLSARVLLFIQIALSWTLLGFFLVHLWIFLILLLCIRIVVPVFCLVLITIMCLPLIVCMYIRIL
jgi:hypothetical protein